MYPWGNPETRRHIEANDIRFGLIRNQQAAVLEELGAVLAFVRAAPEGARMFNFCVVT